MYSLILSLLNGNCKKAFNLLFCKFVLNKPFSYKTVSSFTIWELFSNFILKAKEIFIVKFPKLV